MRALFRRGDIIFGMALAFLFGVFAANMGWNFYFISIIGVLAGFTAIFFRRQSSLPKYMILFPSAMLLGGLYYLAFVHFQASSLKIPVGGQATFFGVITEEPRATGNFIMLDISLLRPYAGTVDIFTSPTGQFHYGDELWIAGKADLSKNVGEPPVLFLPRVRVIAQHQGLWIKEITIDFKGWIVQRITELLPADQAALLSGIMIGTTGTVSAAFKADMETSGTSYIVGMYGYKIAIITFALAAALKDHVSRKMLLFLTLATIILFVFASGGTISAIRAAIMGSFAVIARGTGRSFNARNALTFAATGMVLMDATLLTDAAFQLSFLSFLGIYYLGPPINNYLHWTDEGILQWKSHAMLSLSTNLAILPVVMNTFGEFSLTSFVSNIFIMIPWLAVIVFGAIAVLCSLLSPYLTFCAVRIVSALLQYELFIIHFFAMVTIPIPAMFGSAFVIALYYGALIIFSYYYASSSQKNH
jgi:ComEC/Rec2-related protein